MHHMESTHNQIALASNKCANRNSRPQHWCRAFAFTLPSISTFRRTQLKLEGTHQIPHEWPAVWPRERIWAIELTLMIACIGQAVKNTTRRQTEGMNVAGTERCNAMQKAIPPRMIQLRFFATKGECRHWSRPNFTVA